MTHFTNTDHALPHLAGWVGISGDEVGSRLGERTRERLHEHIVLEKPWQREVLTPHRNVNIAAQIAETMWVLSGRNDVEWLSHYLPRAAEFSDDGKVWRGGYGPRLRAWDTQYGMPGDEPVLIDQIKHVIDVLTEDRASRRAVISIYNPAVDTDPGKDIPCNDFLSFISRDGHLDLSVFVRSNDLIWGWSGINQFEWSALQEIVAGLLGLRVGVLVFNTTSLHVYDRHWSKAQQIAENAQQYPTLTDSPRFDARSLDLGYFDELVKAWFILEDRLRNGEKVFAAVEAFPEPFLQSWLRVIAWYWSGDETYLIPLEGTRLRRVVQEMPRGILSEVVARRKPEPAPFTHLVVGNVAVGSTVDVYPIAKHGYTPGAEPMFVEYVDALHREKSAAYGDSWKKRGEQMSILANIARKIDRLEGGKSTEDEVIADTAIDLLVYLIKYRLWLSEQYPDLPGYVSDPDAIEENDALRDVLKGLKVVAEYDLDSDEVRAPRLVGGFDSLHQVVTLDPHGEGRGPQDRADLVDLMIGDAFVLARHLWEKENGVTPDHQNPYRNVDDSDA